MNVNAVKETFGLSKPIEANYLLTAINVLQL